MSKYKCSCGNDNQFIETLEWISFFVNGDGERDNPPVAQKTGDVMHYICDNCGDEISYNEFWKSQ